MAHHVEHCRNPWNGECKNTDIEVYIYHKGHLAVQSGLYDNYYRGEHGGNYYPRTVATNSMLIHQPGESA